MPPPPTTDGLQPLRALDRLLPSWDAHEQHEAWYDADVLRVWETLDDLRIADLRVTEALLWLRSGPLGWLRGPSADLDVRVLDAVAPKPLLIDPPHELVLGDVASYVRLRPSRPTIPRGDLAAFTAFSEPGWSKVLMDFRLTPERGGTLLRTETRVRNTDAVSRRAFRAYWLLARVGSAVIREDLLCAVGRRTRREAPVTR